MWSPIRPISRRPLDVLAEKFPLSASNTNAEICLNSDHLEIDAEGNFIMPFIQCRSAGDRLQGGY